MVDFLLLKLQEPVMNCKVLGIMEMADTIVINKADGDNIRKAQLAKSEFNRALHLFPAKKVRLDSYNCKQCNYTRRIPVWETITKFIELTKSNDYFNEKRLEQNEYWMLEAINEQLKGNFITIPKYKTCWNQLKAVQNGEISPFAAAQLLLKSTLKNKPSCYVI
jgi:LAO/AO transport system kinase